MHKACVDQRDDLVAEAVDRRYRTSVHAAWSLTHSGQAGRHALHSTIIAASYSGLFLKHQHNLEMQSLESTRLDSTGVK